MSTIPEPSRPRRAVNRKNAVVAPGANLLSARPVRALVVWAAFPYVFQALALAAFVALAILGWQQFAPAGASAKLYAKTNLVTLLIWGLWWPVMIWAAVLLGRVWCAVCPLELVSNLSERAARRIGIPQRSLRRWMLGGALIVGLYAVLQLLVAGAGIHRVPAYTSIFLWTLLLLAIITGLLFKDRAFCRGFCPVGMLLAVYGRGGMLAVRPVQKEACDSCCSRDCLKRANRQKADARSCPSLLNVPQLKSSSDCLLCTQCIKSCQPQNLALLLRRPFSANDERPRLASWPVTLFIMLVSGFVVWELTTEWPRAEKLFFAAPHWLSTQIGAEPMLGYLEGLWTLFVVPLLAWSLLAVVGKFAGWRCSLSDYWRRLALPLAVLLAAGHMCKGLAKFVTWAQFLPYSLQHPDGIQTLATFATQAPPARLLSPAATLAVSAALLLVAAYYALREIGFTRERKHEPQLPLLVPIAAWSSIFMLLVAGWAA